MFTTMRSVSLLLLTIAAFCATALAQDNPPANPREFHDQEMARLRGALEAGQGSALLSTQADYHAVYYDLTVDLRNYSGHIISGKVNVLARSLAPDLDQLILDLCGTLVVDSVRVSDVSAPFTRANNQITITLDRVYGVGEMVSARVVYHGTPCQTNIYQSFSYYTRSVSGHNIPSIATLSEPYGSKDWWPCKDDVNDKADSVRVSIVVADTITGVSNGILESTTTIPPSSRKFTWFESHPISTYLVCASATNYAHFSLQYTTLAGGTMPVEFYPYPEFLTRAQTSWNALPTIITFYAQTFGEYPFVDQKYGQTMFNFSGGMEHQTNTSYGYQITDGSHTFDYIVAHELSHQWFGDKVTCETWPNIWLNEGFASYCEALWAEHNGGADALRNYQIVNNSVTDPSGPVYNPSDLFSSNTVYSKGSWILHMVRGVIRNDSLFFAGLRYYQAQHAYDNATTAEFFADMSTVAGFDIEPYLHAYVYLRNRPQFQTSTGTARVNGQWHTVVRIRQTQTDPDTTFRTRLDLRFARGVTDTARTRVENFDRRQRYYFSLGFQPSSLVVDPDVWVLTESTSETLPLTILSDSLADGIPGVAYHDTLVSLGGSGTTRTWTILNGALPADLNLASNGVITGTPSVGGEFPLQFRVQDTGTGADTLWITLHIASPLIPPPAVTCYPLEDGTIRLLWQAVDADSYRVYRATTADMLDLELIGTTIDTTFVDPLAPAETGDTRFYQISSVRNP